jgi:hypothetical protein
VKHKWVKDGYVGFINHVRAQPLLYETKNGPLVGETQPLWIRGKGRLKLPSRPKDSAWVWWADEAGNDFSEPAQLEFTEDTDLKISYTEDPATDGDGWGTPEPIPKVLASAKN